MVNLSEPGVFVNDVLQLRIKHAGETAARFVTNSTIGLFGLIDVANQAGRSVQLRSGPGLYIIADEQMMRARGRDYCTNFAECVERSFGFVVELGRRMK